MKNLGFVKCELILGVTAMNEAAGVQSDTKSTTQCCLDTVAGFFCNLANLQNNYSHSHRKNVRIVNYNVSLPFNYAFIPTFYPAIKQKPVILSTTNVHSGFN